MACFTVMLLHLNIFLEGLEKATEYICQVS
jgi:hypothetical protein